jgi:hypothetical protein
VRRLADGVEWAALGRGLGGGGAVALGERAGGFRERRGGQQ